MATKLTNRKSMTNEEVLQVFEETGGVLHGHFMLTSGRHSDTYMQCAKLFVSPEHADKLCGELAKKLKDIDIDLVISPALGGVIMGYEMSRQLGTKNVFAERVDGKMELRRGFDIPVDARVLVTEDVVTTGGSVMEVIRLVQDLGGTVSAVASIVDRSNGKIDFGVRYESLLSMDIQSWEEGECPLCAAGELQLVKPGSRKLTAKV